jgi:hypothetical protein
MSNVEITALTCDIVCSQCSHFEVVLDQQKENRDFPHWELNLPDVMPGQHNVNMVAH